MVPIRYYEGPERPRVLIVADFPNHAEQKGDKVLSNSAGKELRRALDQVGLWGFTCGYTYALLSHPEGSNPDNFCLPKAGVGKDYPFAHFRMGKYFPLEVCAPGWSNLQAIVEHRKPELIIALGNVACWMLLGSSAINKLRGSIFTDTKIGVPVLATYSFGQVLKEWALRPIAIADFNKAQRFIKGEYHQPTRRILVEPTMEELHEWFEKEIFSQADRITELSCDIETAKGQITCIGFAPSATEACCVPFFDPDKLDQGKSYWRTAEEEYVVYRLVKRVLESSIPKLGQNFMYDLQYLRKYGIATRNFTHDTMVRHHSLYPEMRKDLGFLATIYTDEAPWKMLRNRHRDALKAED